MSKRLQVILRDSEMTEIQRLAKREHIPVGEWVRRALRAARTSEPVNSPEIKLKAIRRAAKLSYGPAIEIEQMLEEIEKGYRS
jgi:hypothetical protein